MVAAIVDFFAMLAARNSSQLLIGFLRSMYMQLWLHDDWRLL
jgi:hypothetical protein